MAKMIYSFLAAGKFLFLLNFRLVLKDSVCVKHMYIKFYFTSS